jgi:hypothetical protein
MARFPPLIQQLQKKLSLPKKFGYQFLVTSLGEQKKLITKLGD